MVYGSPLGVSGPGLGWHPVSLLCLAKEVFRLLLEKALPETVAVTGGRHRCFVLDWRPSFQAEHRTAFGETSSVARAGSLGPNATTLETWSEKRRLQFHNPYQGPPLVRMASIPVLGDLHTSSLPQQGGRG